jgi:signal transduction histidine kinase
MHLRGETECFEHTYRLRHRSGHDIWVLSRGKALRDASGMPVRFFGAVVDVTRQKTIEERLRQAEDLERNARHQAEAATRAKSAFVASMSHEIRTPMNGVLGMLQILRGTPLNADQSALVATAERSALCLLDLIGDILDLSKVEAGKLEIHPEPFAWQPLLSEVADLMRTRAEAKDIDLRVEVTAPPPAWLLGDSLRLRQILTNLINNAIKFTDHGGVTVTLESAALPDQPGMHRLLWRVKDTGIGISPAAMGRLFKPFSQVDDSTENYRGGTGLGLSISQSLARLMGGDIRAQSVLAEGSTFELVMQAREVAPPEARPNDAADCQREESPLADFCGRLLVVDDSPVGQMVAKLLLEQLGFEVDVVGSGAAAIEKIGSVDYRLVFMDCQMPQMDGYETTRRIRSMMQGSRLPPVVALTANVQPSEMQACLECGMDGYLSKPVTRQALIKTLHLHLARPVLH